MKKRQCDISIVCLASFWIVFCLASFTVIVACDKDRKIAAANGEDLNSITVREHEDIRFFTNKIGMELAYVPKGDFLMGSPDDELMRNADEKQHLVRVSDGFWIGRTEVTQEQWKSIMTDNPSCFNGQNLPVECVSWYMAKQFCRRLTQMEGRLYRLPTEAEWEYACRAGRTTPFNFGQCISTEIANYDGTTIYGNAPKGLRRGRTVPVKSFAPNAWGLYDMHGNVGEWCEDRYSEYVEDYIVNPGAGDDGERVIRGGSYISYPWQCRSACRFNRDVPSETGSTIGFRLVLEDDQLLKE